MRFLATLVGSLAAFAAPVLARAIAESDSTVDGNVCTDHNIANLILPKTDATGKIEVVDLGKSDLPPDVLTSNDASADALYCGFAFNGLGLRGSPLTLVGDQASYDVYYLKSGIISPGCFCTFLTDPKQGPFKATYIWGGWQGDLPLEAFRVVCKQSLNKRDIEGSTVVARDSAEELALSTTEPANENVYYCGYAYSEKDLRGQQFELAADGVAHQPSNVKSAIITGGCQCLFDAHPKSSTGAPDETQATIDGPFHGNLPHDANILACHLTVLKPRREAQPEYAGWGFPEPSFEGYPTHLAVTTEPISNRVRSAIITEGYTCEFYNHTMCTHTLGKNDQFISFDGFKGSLPWDASCTKCYWGPYNGEVPS